jgi:hypothetical protein
MQKRTIRFKINTLKLFNLFTEMEILGLEMPISLLSAQLNFLVLLLV